jgi:hypothetical protein
VSLKIAQWCGFSYSTTEIASFITAADLGVDVVNISFGGYLDRSDPEQELIYQAYIDAVAYARSKGTIIVAAAGNEHVRVGAGGRVVSHGQLSTPGDPPENWPDLFGMYEAPGGIPGVDPPVAPKFNATCKPITDRHQAAGQARRTSWPTTPTTAPGSTSPARAGPASSTWPTSTGAAPPGSPTPPRT